MNQLDLFDTSTPTAEILAFPAARMRGDIRHTASDILRQPSHGITARLNRKVGILRLRLLLLGLPSSVIAAEAKSYRDAIESEMRRRLILDAMLDHSGGAA